jgi:hypothetical protein
MFIKSYIKDKSFLLSLQPKVKEYRIRLITMKLNEKWELLDTTNMDRKI